MSFPPCWTKLANTGLIALILLSSIALAHDPPKIPKAPSNVVWVSPAGNLFSLDGPLIFTKDMGNPSSALYKNISSSVCENARMMLSKMEVFKRTWKECFTVEAQPDYYTIMIYFGKGPMGEPPFNVTEEANHIRDLIEMSIGSPQHPYFIENIRGVAAGGTSPMMLTSTLLLACLLLAFGIRLFS